MPNLILVPQDYSTIQAAINNALDYDTIRVAPGTYTENITVNKTIQLLGAQAGIDARTRAGTQESIITGTGSTLVRVSADNVVVDGFTIQGNTAGNGVHAGNVSGYWIFNNIIQNNTLGVFLEPNSGTTTSQLRQNLVRDNVSPTGNGIFLRALNVFIDSNRITGHRENASINITEGATNVIISNNDIIDDTSIALEGSTNIKIANNRLIDTQGTAIFIGGDTNITEIEGNIISGSTGNGISVNNIFSAVQNQNIRAKDNSIEGNQLAGLNVAAASYNNTAPNRPLDATNNWWGSPSGPNVNGGGPGTGQAITDPDMVTLFSPFLGATPFVPVPPVTPVQRLSSSAANVYVATDREMAVAAANLGTGTLAVEVPQFPIWASLTKFVNDNNPVFGAIPDPTTVWSSSMAPGQVFGFAASSSSFTITSEGQVLIYLTAFADNAMEAQIDLVDATTNTLISSPPLGTLLLDGSMDPTPVVLEPPFNWQNIRCYSISTAPIPAGQYKVIVSFTVVNYDQYMSYPYPAGLSFVADIYSVSV